jgi:hypothetical protein
MRGIEEPPLRVEEPPLRVEGVAVDASVLAADFEASERPGATAETSAAKPAVSAAAPTITQRRVRPIRARAASRAIAARDLSGPSLLMVDFTIGRGNQRSVRAK